LHDPRITEDLATRIFQRPELKYQQAEREYGQQLGRAKTAADVEREQAEEQRKIDLPDKTDKKIDEYTNDQQQRVQVMQRPDGSTYERVGGKVFEKPEGNFQEQAYQEALKANPKLTRLQFAQQYAGATQKPERPPQPQRMLGVTPDNKVIEITPGMTLPPGTKPLGGELSATLKSEQGEEAGKSAQQYAKDYLESKNFTGPGDEALMEKFFELAKPSSGFRMTKAQQDMLKNAQSWRNSATAFVRHATTGTWFSEEQRKQIVDTMGALQKSREEVKPGAGGTTAAPTSGAALPSFKQWKQSQGQGNP
jgi:hypothetical protein